MSKLLKVLGVALTIGIILLFSLTVMQREHITGLINSEIENYGLLSVNLITILLELIPQYIGPHFILIQADVLGLPIISSSLMAVLGASLGSVLGFALGKRYGSRLVYKWYEKKMINNISQKIEKYGVWIILIAALSPLPYIPLIFGLFDMKWKSIILFGMIPRSISLIVLGLILL